MLKSQKKRIKSYTYNEYYQQERIKNSNEEIKVTIILVTYNPSINKLRVTLDSILDQCGIKFNVIISDDGSKDNCFEWIRNYMFEKKFDRYILIDHKYNQGTVKNVFDALLKAEGKYIKLISPGDAINGKNVLAKWIDTMVSNGAIWSFSDAIYYKPSSMKNQELRKIKSSPQYVYGYNKRLSFKCRWRYVILDDMTLGAATIMTKEVALDYLKKIVEKVIYAEDFIFRIMMYDGVIPLYYPDKTIRYEYGTGISTMQNDLWNQRLRDDLAVSDEIIIDDDIQNDVYKTKLRKALVWKRKHMNDRFWKYEKYLLKGKLLLEIKKRISPRLVEIEND